MPASLRLSYFYFQVSVEPCRFQTRAVTGDGNVFEAQVNAYAGLRRIRLLNGNRHGQANVPISDRILRKATRLPLSDVGKPFRLEHTECFSAESEVFSFATNAGALERHPPQERLDPKLTRHRNFAFFA